MSMQIDIDVKDIDVHLDADSLHGRLVSAFVFFARRNPSHATPEEDVLMVQKMV